MSGTAGSKYGIVKDDVPIKSRAKKPRKRLKNLRRILKKKVERSK